MYVVTISLAGRILKYAKNLPDIETRIYNVVPSSVFKTHGRPVAPGDQKLGWTSEIWPWASKNYNRSYKKGNFQNISGRLSGNFSLKHCVIMWSIFRQKTPCSSPIRARYGVSFEDPASDWYSASVPVIIYVICYNIGLCYNGTRLYKVLSHVHRICNEG